jgi:preprotein translocase subunit SecG
MTFLMILLFILALLLIFVVLLQPSKGDMVSSSFGGGLGGSMSSMFGARGSLQFLQKTTIGIAVLMVVVSVAVNIMIDAPTDAEGETRKAASESTNWQGVDAANEQAAPAPVAQPVPTENQESGKDGE